MLSSKTGGVSSVVTTPQSRTTSTHHVKALARLRLRVVVPAKRDTPGSGNKYVSRHAGSRAIRADRRRLEERERSAQREGVRARLPVTAVHRGSVPPIRTLHSLLSEDVR
jgi:hypothetical protein